MKTKKGLELWNKAKDIIPGGTQLLSKRSEMFLPNQWPSFYKKAKGINLWDMDENKLTDMSMMGIGSCILGYADPDVNNAVKNAIENGSMSTLNSYEEIDLADILLSLNKWADMVRYARTGGEAMTVAVRLGRAYSKKDKLAFCGYHGWHDWYLSSNLSDDSNLDGHLLPGLEPLGVPRTLQKTSLPFTYDKIKELEELISNHDIGTIIVEPIRHHNPTNDFLKKVRKISDEIGAVLVFDEVTSGWRMNVGGIHQLFGVNPDIAVYGKGMSNGYPMAAIVGKKDIMNMAQQSFISSTYWTERIGPTAAIAAIKKMKEKNVPDHLKKIGKEIGLGWERSAKENNIDIDIMWDVPPLITFSFLYKNSQEIKTLFTQEMLERGYLASPSVYVSYMHKKDDLKKYFENVDEVFKILSKAIEKDEVKKHLKGPVAHKRFERLTT